MSGVLWLVSIAVRFVQGWWPLQLVLFHPVLVYANVLFSVDSLGVPLLVT